jgi:hypothetical protein
MVIQKNPREMLELTHRPDAVVENFIYAPKICGLAPDL